MRLRKDPDGTEGAPSADQAVVADVPARAGTPGRARSQLGELLVSSQLITHDQLAEALIQQSASGERIGTTLVALGAIGERDLAKALSTQLLVPMVDLSQQAPTPEAIEVLPESVARAHLAVPIVVDEGGITVAVSDPTPELAKVLANSCGRVVRLVIAPKSDVQRAIERLRRLDGSAAVGHAIAVIAYLWSMKRKPFQRSSTTGSAVTRRSAT